MIDKTIAIWDRNQLFREGLRSLLGNSQFTVVASSDVLADVLDGDDDGDEPALIICGLDSSDEMPFELIHRPLCGRAGPRFVVLANAPNTALMRRAAEAGVYAVLSKNISSEILQRALDFVLLGQRLFPAPHIEPTNTSRLEIMPPPTALRSVHVLDRPKIVDQTVQLSEREAQILGCLVEGAPNKQIARDLGITEATVKVHIKGLLRKLRVSNRTQAAVWGLNNPYSTDPRLDALSVVNSPVVPFAIAV